MTQRNMTLFAIAASLAIAFIPAYLITIPLFLVFIITGFYLSDYFVENNGPRLFSIFLFSYILKIMLAMLCYAIAMEKGFDGFFYGRDDYAFGNTGILLADSWRQGVFPSFLQIKRTLSLSGTMGFYQYYLAVLMLISENNTFLPIFLNCTVSSLSIFIMYAFCKELFNEHKAKLAKIGLMAAGLLAFWPSITLWSTLNLKEAFTISFILLAGYAFAKILKRNAKAGDIVRHLAMLILLICLSDLLKPGFSLFFILASMIGLFLFYIHKLFDKSLPLGFFVLFCTLVLLLFILVVKYDAANSFATYVGNERDLRAIGGSAIMPNVEIRNFFQLLSFFPQAFIIAFFYPFPWQVRSAGSLLASPEMIMWYALLPFFLRGIVRAVNMKIKAFYFVFGFLIAYCFFLGFFDSNSGTLFRHRALALPFAFILVSLGAVPIEKKT